MIVENNVFPNVWFSSEYDESCYEANVIFAASGLGLVLIQSTESSKERLTASL